MIKVDLTFQQSNSDETCKSKFEICDSFRSNNYLYSSDLLSADLYYIYV